MFDLETVSVSSATKSFLKKAEKEGRFISVCGEELPKAFIATADGTVYASKISAATLANRAKRKMGEF